MPKKMKPFATLFILFFVLFIFKPSIVTIIEKKTTISITKEAMEEDDNNEEKKIASFEQSIAIEIKKKQINKTTQTILFDAFSIPTNYIQKINIPPPRNV